MIIKKINDGWYIGQHAGLTFFARTRSDLYRKFWFFKGGQMKQPKHETIVYQEQDGNREWVAAVNELFQSFPGGTGIAIAYGATRESAKKAALRRLDRLKREVEKL